MKNLIYITLISLLFTSCLSSKKYLPIVNQEAMPEIVKSANQDWLIINADNFEPSENKCKKGKSLLVPLIFYWFVQSSIECEIGSKITSSYIKNSIYKAADSLSLRKKLPDGKLIINLRQIPSKFLYLAKGHLIFLGYTMEFGSERISPTRIRLIADFELLSGTETKTKGQVIITNTEKPLKRKWGQTTQTFTRKYLSEYRKEIDKMGKELIEEIMTKGNLQRIP
ncbi:MAG: hypothetical protein ACI8P3_003407 [Saprospiraceae bacterium]|jgi:hypothetical protein